MIETGDIQVIIEDGTNANLCQQIAYIKAGKTEIEEAVQEGIGDFNTNATEKTNTFNSNASAKTLAFNQNADAKTLIYDNNASEKLTAYNENATNKLADFNTNATNKTTAFDLNATNKTNTFNDNAISKTDDFNTNATNKTTAFNTNASDKTTAFNNNYQEKKTLIDADVQLAKDWATKTDGTVDGVDYSAKYYAQSILPIKDDITAVAEIATDVADVAEIKDEVTAVAQDKENVNAVGNNISNVNTVAGDHANIQTVVNNMTAINNAPTYANNSKIWAEGLDGEVAPLGGTHSSKGWAQIAEQAASGVQNPANRDLSNLTNTGQVIIDSQNGTISNCILEIPQNIKLTLENNVLTLKAGSVLTKTGSTYETITTSSDLVRSGTFTPNRRNLVFTTNGTGFGINRIERTGSGSSLPADNSQYDWFFNTTDKKMYWWGDGGFSVNNLTYPICVVDVDSQGNVSFAKDSKGNDMIFNGAGFVGHHAFVYPNIRKLSPNGFSSNGNLSSVGGSSLSLTIIEMTVAENSVYFNPNGTIARGYISYWDSLAVAPQNSWKKIYVRDINKSGNYYNNVFTEISVCAIAIYTYDGTTVTDFAIRQPYEGARDLVTDSLQADVTTLTGYDSTQTQTLKNINGVLTWVTD